MWIYMAGTAAGTIGESSHNHLKLVAFLSFDFCRVHAVAYGLLT